MTDTLPVMPTSTLTPQITVMAEALRQPASEMLPQYMRSLVKAGFAFPADMDATEALDIYAYALQGQPAAALKRVVEKLIRGEMERSETGLFPKPPQLAAMVRAEAKIMRDDLARMRDVQASKDELARIRDRKPKDPAMKARVAAMVARVAATRTVSEEGGAS